MYSTPVATRTRRLAAFSSATIIVAVGIAVAIGLSHVFEHQATIRRSESIIRANDDLLQRLTDAETGQRGYIIVGDSNYLNPYRGAKADVKRAADTLLGLLAADPAAQHLAERLDSVAARRLDVLDERIAIRTAAGFDSARKAIIAGRGRVLMDTARLISDAIEQRYVARLSDQLAGLARDARILFAVISVGTALAAIVALLLNSLLAGTANRQQAVATLLGAQNTQLRTQSDELQRQRSQLEERTAELRAANEGLEERTAEAERLRIQAEAANQGKSAFLAMMSHDLRTPLNAIGGYADLLDIGVAGDLNEMQRTYVRRITTSNRFLIALINDVLSFAKTEAGQVEMHVESVAVGDFLSSIEPMVAPQMIAGGLGYQVSHSCGAVSCGTRALVDPEKLRQIILNLVSNAIKFTPTGGWIRLRCGCDATQFWIDVHDTGIGIPAEKLEEIFEPFTQLESKTRGDSRSGVGLGLAISRELARRMGGDLTAVSELGTGTTFTLRLPRDGQAHPPPDRRDVVSIGTLRQRGRADANV